MFGNCIIGTYYQCYSNYPYDYRCVLAILWFPCSNIVNTKFFYSWEFYVSTTWVNVINVKQCCKYKKIDYPLAVFLYIKIIINTHLFSQWNDMKLEWVNFKINCNLKTRTWHGLFPSLHFAFTKSSLQ